MLVRKLKSEWQPSENPSLNVDETIEITDPKSLIISGTVIGIGEEGEELSAYDLYGVIVDTDREDFDEFMKHKRATALEVQAARKVQLEKEKKALQEEAVKTVEPVVKPILETVPDKTVSEVKSTATKSTRPSLNFDRKPGRPKKVK